MKKKAQNIKYDFGSVESQKLFQEFTILLDEISEYIDKREIYIKFLEENQHREDIRIREMVVEIIRRLLKTVWRLISFIPKKLVDLFRKR